MAYIEAALRTYILADSTIAGHIGTRLFPVEAPANTSRPYMVYHVVADPDNRFYVGSDASQPTFQFDIVANTFTKCKAIDLALRSRISEVHGVTIGTIPIIRIEPTSYRDITKVEDFFECQRDFRVNYER